MENSILMGNKTSQKASKSKDTSQLSPTVPLKTYLLTLTKKQLITKKPIIMPNLVWKFLSLIDRTKNPASSSQINVHKLH